VFISSDHAFEHGGSLIKEYIESALDKGVSRLCIVDTNSMAGAIGFVKECKKAKIEHIVGVRLSIYDPIISESLWALKNKVMLERVVERLGFDNDFKTNYENWITILDALLAYHTSKAASKRDIFHNKLADIVDSNTLDITPASAKAIRPFIAKFNRTKEASFITCVAKNESGYRRLMRLLTLRSYKHKKGIEFDNDCVSFCELNLSEVLEDSDNIEIIDGLEQDSLLGAVYHNDLPNSSQIIECYHNEGIKVGVPVNADAALIEYINGLDLNAVPYHYARFSDEYAYDDFRIKYAILTKKLINSFSFSMPVSKDDFMRDAAFIGKFYASVSKKLSVKFDCDFWKAIQLTDVVLDQVVLPNCQIPESEVSEYACALLGLEAKSQPVFEAWIESTLKDDCLLSEHRRSRYEAYYMHKLSYEGAMRKLKIDYPDDYEDRRGEYVDRHKTEFEIIDDMGFSGYFLIMHDIVSYARKIGVPVGEARGSAAGSLIVYGLDITDVDPLRYDLQFERFLNPERVSMPDIDVDFGHNGTVGRDDVLDYVRKKYSSSDQPFTSVSQISNTNRFMLKKSLPAACEAYGLPSYYKKYVSSLVKDAEVEFSIKPPETISWEELRKYEVVAQKLKNEPVLARVFDKAQALFKKKETCGVHAGGLVIAPTMVPDHSALSLDSRGNFVSEYDKDDIETAGLIKFDLLGLESLSILSCANLLVEKRTGSLVDIRNIPKDDPKVFSLINQNITLGVFQIESQGMRSLISQLQPENINELAVLSALFRPGALQSGMVEDYVDTKHNRKALTYDHPEMESATKETYGCIVFQEQVMSVVRLLAGYSLGEADQLRRAMGKKKIEEMIRHKTVFTQRAQKFWRSDFIQKGKSKFTEFELDPDVSDLASKFPALELGDFLLEGYFSEVSKVEGYLTSLLGLGRDSSEKLHNRLADINYTVKVFKEDYQEGITVGVTNLLSTENEGDVKEVQTRLFFALAQWVRFNCIFNKIEKFAGYGFNKSHAIGYSLITYATAYFKTKYPPEFYASTMSFAKLENIDALAKEAISKMQVPILKPSLNKSCAMFTTEGKSSVRYGLSKLAGVLASGGIIESARGDKDYTSLADFIHRFKAFSGKGVGKTAVYGLALTGAFDEFIPSVVAKMQGVNGREFIYELIMNLKSSTLMNEYDLEKVSLDSLHARIMKLEVIEIISYWLTSMTVKRVKDWIDTDEISDTKETNDGSNLKALVENFLSALCIILQKPKAKSVEIQNDKSQFEFHFDKVKLLISSMDIEIEELLLAKFKGAFNMSLVDTVNEEKRICGMYLTMSPLDAIDAFNKIEREPPSSMVDGCPIRLSDIDEDVDGESVMTVGVIRNVIHKQVSNPESDYFTQKILEFHLEDGLDLVKYSIFGTRTVDKMSPFIEDGGIIMAVGKVSYSEKYGMSVRLEAFKRYHPEMDEFLTKVPKTRRF
tara:strand:- start:24115 stop:28452 length:4338 start_codon:yes stop_codon:yes gene_type:complete